MKKLTCDLNNFSIRISGKTFEVVMNRDGKLHYSFVTVKKLKRVIKKLEKAQLKNNVTELKNQRDKLTKQNRGLKLQFKNKVKK